MRFARLLAALLVVTVLVYLLDHYLRGEPIHTSLFSALLLAGLLAAFELS